MNYVYDSPSSFPTLHFRAHASLFSSSHEMRQVSIKSGHVKFPVKSFSYREITNLSIQKKEDVTSYSLIKPTTNATAISRSRVRNAWRGWTPMVLPLD
jgi:hypothetical protein